MPRRIPVSASQRAVIKKWLVRATKALALLGAVRVGYGGEAQLRIEQRRPVAPVLIRSEFNPLELITVRSPAKGLRLRRLVVDMSRTDSMKDIASVEVFIGDKAEGSARFGKAADPGVTVSFEGDVPVVDGTTFSISVRPDPKANLAHYVSAGCTRLEFSDGTILDKDAPTASERRHLGIALRKHQDDGIHTHRIPSLATSKRGTLFCVYDLRRRAGRDLQEDIDIGLSRSTDGGKSWAAPKVIMDMGTYGNLPQEQNGCSDPGIIADRKTGEIFVFAVWMWGKPGKHQWNDDGSEPGFEIGKSAQLMLVRSRDDGKTWSQPENLTRMLKKQEWWLLAPAPQQGIQLPDGTLVMPMQGRDAKGIPFATIMHSRDHGKSWTVGEPAFSEGNECQAVQLGDGSIMLNMRNDHRNGYRAVAVTRDLGRTWAFHPTHENTLIEPNCNASLFRIDYEEDGRRRHALLFSNPQSKTARTHQTLQVSFDDGMTWPSAHHRLLDEGRGAGYSSLTRIDNRHVGIIYEGSRAQLVFERFSLDELLHPRP